MAETVFLRRLSRWQADQQREAVADLYVAAYRDVPGQAPPDRRDFLDRFATDVQRPAFDMVIGSAGGTLVACAYGFRTDPGASSSGKAQVFTVAELMVLPAHRHRRVAGSMLERLFARTDAPVALARVARANTGARAAYRAWGWQRTGPVADDDAADPAAAADDAAAAAADARDVWTRRLRG